MKNKVIIDLSESELRYLLASGYGLFLNIPKESLSNYINFNADEINEVHLNAKNFGLK
ncbi:hypothetical protein PSSHI_12760 [Photobacterium sp. R1]